MFGGFGVLLAAPLAMAMQPAAAVADAEVQTFADVRQHLEMRHVELAKDEQRYWNESEEALDAGRSLDEQLAQVRDRLGSVTTELGLVEKQRADAEVEKCQQLLAFAKTIDFHLNRNDACCEMVYTWRHNVEEMLHKVLRLG